MLVNPYLLTFAAFPVDEMGAHQNFLSKLFIKLIEVLDEIENIIIVTGIPNVVFDSVVWPPQIELNENRNLLLCLRGSSLHEIKEFLTFFV
jgi:hypothetical protein